MGLRKRWWSNEKCFVFKQKPNKQNECYWAPCDPGVWVECREQGGKKVMCWAGEMLGKLIIGLKIKILAMGTPTWEISSKVKTFVG